MNTTPPPSTQLPSPFAVGDIIYEGTGLNRQFAKVVANTDEGFDYTYFIPWAIHPLGDQYTGGTCFPGGYHLWTKSDPVEVMHHYYTLYHLVLRPYWFDLADPPILSEFRVDEQIHGMDHGVPVCVCDQRNPERDLEQCFLPWLRTNLDKLNKTLIYQSATAVPAP